MEDFRSELYRRYVSTFKVGQTRIDDASLRRLWRWYEAKYFPLIADVDRDSAVLELGCGPGYMLEFLKNKGFQHVEGVDISEEQIELARNRQLNARTEDVWELLRNPEPKWSLVIAVDFLEHFSREELLRLLPRICELLVPGGIFLAQTPNGRGLFSRQIIYDDLTHMTILTPSSLDMLLKISGFEVGEYYESGPIPKGFKGRIRSISWSFIKFAANAARIVEANKQFKIWTENMICVARKPK